MIVYLADKLSFREDVLSNRIEEKIQACFRARRASSVGASEIASWKNSLGFMDRVLSDPDIPDDSGVAIEYGVPNSAKRIDFVLTGTNALRQKTAVIVELKQWSDAEVTGKDAVVRTFLNGSKREVPHPSYQAWCYAALLEDYNETVRTEPIRLHPCAYLHNCGNAAAIRHPHYKEHLDRAPVFLKDDATKLREFLRGHVRHGDKGQAIYEINAGRIRPSKNLGDCLLSLLKGNKEFVLIDDQKVVYETALDLAEKAAGRRKQTLIVEGGPGTGKSVVAINLLVELTAREKVTTYVTKNSAPRAVYQSKLRGSFTQDRISNLFKNSGSFVDCDSDTFDVLVVDEAHRLNEKSGMFKNKGENQIKELIEASKLSVFFVDGAQRVTMHDIGDVESIRNWAHRCRSEVTELTLESQFRCNGSDGYLAWVDNTLGIRSTANASLEGIAYDFRVCDRASELRNLIRERNAANNKSRMVAGYCWDWVSKKEAGRMDIVLPEEDFAAQWNLDTDGSLWILKPDSVEQVGCIHTCQGLELEYVGVIFGPDLVIRDGRWVEFPNRRSKMDSSIKGWKKLSLSNLEAAQQKARQIIRNTYRTLMTRGQKGCFVYSVDPETNVFLKEAARGAQILDIKPGPTTEEKYPFNILPDSVARPYENCVPCYLDLRAAAGAFSEEQIAGDCLWAELPEPLIPKRGFFLVKVVGESMNRRIPNGSWCLFRVAPAGSRQGKVVLVQHRDIQEDGADGCYTVKVYRSEKNPTEEGWTHSQIILQPDSSDRSFRDIVLNPAADKDFKIMGEFVAVVG